MPIQSPYPLDLHSSGPCLQEAKPFRSRVWKYHICFAMTNMDRASSASSSTALTVRMGKWANEWMGNDQTKPTHGLPHMWPLRILFRMLMTLPFPKWESLLSLSLSPPLTVRGAEIEDHKIHNHSELRWFRLCGQVQCAGRKMDPYWLHDPVSSAMLLKQKNCWFLSQLGTLG